MKHLQPGKSSFYAEKCNRRGEPWSKIESRSGLPNPKFRSGVVCLGIADAQIASSLAATYKGTESAILAGLAHRVKLTLLCGCVASPLNSDNDTRLLLNLQFIMGLLVLAEAESHADVVITSRLRSLHRVASRDRSEAVLVMHFCHKAGRAFSAKLHAFFTGQPPTNLKRARRTVPPVLFTLPVAHDDPSCNFHPPRTNP